MKGEKNMNDGLSKSKKRGHWTSAETTPWDLIHKNVFWFFFGTSLTLGYFKLSKLDECWASHNQDPV